MGRNAVALAANEVERLATLNTSAGGESALARDGQPDPGDRRGTTRRNGTRYSFRGTRWQRTFGFEIGAVSDLPALLARAAFELRRVPV